MLSLAACRQNISSISYHADGGQTVTIADKDAGKLTAEIGSGAKMPSDLPPWAPAYPGSTIVMAQHQDSTHAGGMLENVMLQTSDEVAKVSAFYDRQLAQAGVRSVHTINSPDASIRMVEMPTTMISINATKADDGDSTISISRIAKN